MTDYTRGGHGKKAPYETEMYRIPTPIKETVQQLSTAYKRLCNLETTISPSHLIKQVQTAIAKIAYSQSDLEAPTNLISSKEGDDATKQLKAIRELVSKWGENVKATRDWTKAKQLLKELEEQLVVSEE